MRVFSVKCPGCGNTVDLDLDHIQGFCGYCGSKLMIDVSEIQTILKEKELTKREEEKTKQVQAVSKARQTQANVAYAQEKTKQNETKYAVIASIGMMIVVVIIWVGLFILLSR